MTEAISSVQQLEDAVVAVLPNDSRAELFFKRARDIVSNGFVKDVTVNSATKEIAATVSSATQAWKQHYTVTCCLSSISAADPRFANSCTCPQHELTGVCKHSIAVALTQLLPCAATKAAQETAAQPSQPARCSAERPAAVVKQSTVVPAESAAQRPNRSGDQPSPASAAGRPPSPTGAGAAGVPSAAAPPPPPRQTQGGMLGTQHGTQLTQGGSRKLPASLRRPAASKPASSPEKKMQTRPSQSQPKLKQALLKRPAARTGGRAAQAPAAAAAGPSAAGQRLGSTAKAAGATKSRSHGLEPFQTASGQRHVRMDGTSILQVEDSQLLAQCRKVLAAEEASARSDVTAVSVSQPAAVQPATQHAPQHGPGAALLVGSTQYPQFTLPPSRDSDATLPVELSEDTRQRRAALILQREAAGSAAPPVAPSEALPAEAASARQRSSAATQQQQPAARKIKPSLLDSLLGPSQATQASQQPTVAQPSQPHGWPVHPPAAAAAIAITAQAAAPDTTGGAAGPRRPSMPQKKKSLFDVMLG